MSPYLSRHVDNDDMRQWAFERNSRLPRDTFQRRRDPDRIVFFACVVLAALVAGLWLGGGLL